MNIAETDYVKMFNLYGKIEEESKRLDSPYIYLKNEKKEIASGLAKLIDDFRTIVPEEIVNHISLNVLKIQERCAEYIEN